MAATVLLAFLGLVSGSWAQTFQPIAFALPTPPALTGTLQPNYALYNAEKMHRGQIAGASSFAFLNGNVYTVTTSGNVINVATCKPTLVARLAAPNCRGTQCGFLTSIRPDLSMPGMLLVLDAYRGLFRVNPVNGAVQQLYSSATPIGGRPPVYLNGMVQSRDGLIFMSDSSDKYNAYNDIYIIMEGRPSGRILALNPVTLSTTEVRRGLVYPNGLELTPDNSMLLVSESGRARIIGIGLTQTTWMNATLFSNNLPGLPGNIRRSTRGTYWVGLSYVRHSGIRNSMDTYSRYPQIRAQTVQQVNQQTIRSYYPRYGLIVELRADGTIAGSLHDPTGRAISSVSEAVEHDGLLYFGSPDQNYVGRIVLPQGEGRVVTVDSVLQVLRSRCQIPEASLAQARRVLTEYINRQTGQQQRPTTPAPSNPQVSTAAAVSTTTAAPTTRAPTTTQPAPTTTTPVAAPTTTTTAAPTTTTTTPAPTTTTTAAAPVTSTTAATSPAVSTTTAAQTSTATSAASTASTAAGV